MVRFARLWLLSTFFFLTASFLTPSAWAYTAWDKVGRGIANIVTSPYEIIRQGMIDFEDHGGIGVFSGSIRGVFCMVGRIVVGAYEVVTFPIPVPSNFRPILYPEYVLSSAGYKEAHWGEDNVQRVY